jgi:hypothetical protein
MTISRTSSLSKPEGDNPIPLGTLAYFRARTKQRMYNLVLKELKQSGISKAVLARRLRKTPAQISRIFGGPGNWTLDTGSDLLFAIGGGELDPTIAYPLDKPVRNYSAPEWMTDSQNKIINAARERLSQPNTAPDPISWLSGASKPSNDAPRNPLATLLAGQQSP